MQLQKRCDEYEAPGSTVKAIQFTHLVLQIFGIALLFAVLVLLTIVCIRVSALFDDLEGGSATEKVQSMLKIGLKSAENTQLATNNILEVTDYAKRTARLAAPQLEQAVNETSNLVQDLRSWSFHPSLAIGPGRGMVG